MVDHYLMFKYEEMDHAEDFHSQRPSSGDMIPALPILHRWDREQQALLLAKGGKNSLAGDKKTKTSVKAKGKKKVVAV